MLELMWFVLGAITYKLLSKLLAITQATIVYKSAERHILVVLATLTEDISYIKALKYKAMLESDVSPEKIKKSKIIDEEFFNTWKITCVRNIHAAVPIYIKPSFETWEDGMRLVTNFYKEQKREGNRKQ